MSKWNDARYNTLKPGTVIRLPDGREGTICYRSLDGEGGVWGRHDFSGIPVGFNDEWPAPDFMLREKDVEELLLQNHKPGMVCVGEKYEVVEVPE